MRRIVFAVLVGVIVTTVAAVASENTPPLHVAAMLGDAFTVKGLLSRGANPNQRDSHGETALMNAPTLEVVRLLLANGADVNAKNSEGTTALMKACFQGAWMVVDELLDKGADVIPCRRTLSHDGADRCFIERAGWACL